MEQLRVIQVGLGGFGGSWLRHLKEVTELKLAALVDLSPANIERAKERFGFSDVPGYTDHRKAFAEVEADLVLLITPPFTHLPLTADALEAGLHVIMEKPMAYSQDQALQLLQLTRNTDKHVMVNQNYRWRPELQALRQALEQGYIGAPEYIRWEFTKHHRGGQQTAWRQETEHIFLHELSIHHFDLMLHILGRKPESVYAESYNPTWSWAQGNAVASASIHFEGGVRAHYFGSSVNWGKETSWNGQASIVGSKGALEFVDDVASMVGQDDTRTPLLLPEMPYIDQAYTLKDMVRAIREGRKPVTHLENNMISFTLVNAAIESAKQGKRMTIDLERFQYE